MTLIHSNWSAPSSIHAFTTTRIGGHSVGPYASNNLGLHVDDDVAAVMDNRQQLCTHLTLPSEPIWLNQTHSTRCILAESDLDRNADAAITRTPGVVLAIMTADCLPIMLCNQEGTEIGAIHSGWKGLASGIVEQTLSKIQTAPEALMAWIGPAVCGNCYEVGEDVYQAYTNRYPYTASSFISRSDKYLANLPAMAMQILNACGVASVYHAKLCTFEQDELFYSYRREAQTGRMATLIWMK